MAKESGIEVDGIITETLPNSTFRVELDKGHKVLAHVCCNMKIHYIKYMSF